MIAKTQAAAIPFAINLLTDPHDNVHGFAAEVLNGYARSMKKYEVHGLLYIHANDAEWAAAPGNTVAGVVADRPINNLPAALAPNAAAAMVAQATQQRTRVEEIAEAVEGLRQRTLASIGPTNERLMRHPIDGMRNFTDRQIVARMIERYGTLTAVTIAKYKKFLLIAILATQDFEALAADHREMHERLARGNQPVSEFDKCLFLQMATASRHDVSEAIASFKVEHPRVDQQVFDDLVAHVVEQAPNLATTTAGAGYAGAMLTPAAVQQIITDAVAKAYSAAATGQSAPGKTRSHRKPPLGTGYRHYCYLHGYCNSHSGATCLVMTNAAAGTYSAAQIAASSHTTCVGGSVKQA